MTMKKYFILISAAIMALACTKELTDNQEAYDGELKTITFESLVTKTTIAENGAVAWEEGDRISVYYVNAEGAAAEAIATATSAGATATFTAQIPVADTPTEYYAAYPAGCGVLDVENNKFYLNIKNSVCDGTFKSANFSASYTSAGAMSLQFHNAVGMIKLAIPEGGQFSKDGVNYKLSGVYMRGQTSAFDGKNNNGPVQFNPSDATFGDPVDLTVGEIEYGDGDANINMPKLSAEALSLGYVYIPTLPGTWPTGLCIRYLADFEDVKNGALPAVLSQETPVEIKRGEVRELDDQTTNIHLNYYVSSTGEGNGLTAEAPMSFAKMQEMLDKTGTAMSGCYALQRVTFNILAGTHALGNTITIPTAKATYIVTIKGLGSATSRTVLDAGKQFGVINVGANVHLYLTNINIINGNATGWGGLRCGWGSSATDSNSIVDCEKCVFDANTSTSVGAAVRVDGSPEGGVVRFNGCSFTNNKSSSGGGSAFYNLTPVAAMFNKCSFKGNTGTADGVCIFSGNSSNTKARLAINNCTLNVGNHTSGNGAGISVTGYNVIANSTLWCSTAIGKRGVIAMGIHKTLNDPAGSAVINCFLHNPNTGGTAYKAIWMHSNYYQNVSNSIYAGLDVSNTTNGMYTVNNSASFSGAAEGKNTDDKKVDGVQHYAYTWTWTDLYKDQMTPVTVEEVNQEIEAVPNIGPLFMNWLKTIPNSLDTDIYGVSRTPASCPGSYQQAGTPVGQ